MVNTTDFKKQKISYM